jgi:Ca2+-binding RTX toxin-like protein
MATIQTGGIGNDKWIGTAQNDVFFALAGNDLCIAGDGNDIVNAGAGIDKVKGGAGDDVLNGGSGDDTLNAGSGNDHVFGGAGDDTIDAGSGDDKVFGGSGDDTIFGGSGNDKIFGGAGDDTIDGGSGVDRVSGGIGNDNIRGGSGNDILQGDDGDDFISGGLGDDRVSGGNGDDTLDWDDGEGNDIMSGGVGRDIIEVNGSVTKGDDFVLGKNSRNAAFFERVGFDGQQFTPGQPGGFNLVVDTSEQFNVFGEEGNDTLVVNDLTNTSVDLIQFTGGEGNDTLNASNTTVRVVADGGAGDDILAGGTGTLTTIVGTNTVTLGDTLTGGVGRDKFEFLTNPFANGTPGQNVNQPDVITDFTIGEDQIVIGGQVTGINALTFQSGNSNQLTGNSNLIVLTDAAGFKNAGLAAQAIADNPNVTAGRGIFVYFNTTLGISRVVFSEDLANKGRFSVLGNLANQTNIANQVNFTAAEFSLA